jgi:hypothetical protein
MGQGGNAAEWMETEADGTNDRPWSVRSGRGAAWDYSGFTLSSSFGGSLPPESELDYSLGFRVASVPEPTSIILTMLASGMLLIRRKR